MLATCYGCLGRSPRLRWRECGQPWHPLAACALPHPAPGVLHTIVFNRALGHVRPLDVESELFDVTYVRAPPMPRAWEHIMQQQ